MFRIALASSVLFIAGATWAAEEQPLDHIGMVMDEIQRDVQQEGARTLAPTRKSVSFGQRSCNLQSKDDKQSSYSCQLDFNVSDEFSSNNMRRATFILTHDFATDTWSSR